MCLGIPGKIISLKGKKARVLQNGHYHWLDITLIDKKLKKGDYLIAYQNVAINKISAQNAREMMALINGRS